MFAALKGSDFLSVLAYHYGILMKAVLQQCRQHHEIHSSMRYVTKTTKTTGSFGVVNMYTFGYEAALVPLNSSSISNSLVTVGESGEEMPTRGRLLQGAGGKQLHVLLVLRALSIVS